ncbi:hypothetical protein [Streptomyces sp. BSP1]|uniref:hypothetical protein n=1 Tax=Streptomyces sp. BSP1 TaxID=2944804 RepID=UPI00211F2FAD|nr:hypothetical protein [Streptomyces sp. BSP1]MCQ9707589.1 hypothetical protein [Streptomyces sp. BSP1]
MGRYRADVGLVRLGVAFRQVSPERLGAVGGPVAQEGEQDPQPFGEGVDDLGADARAVRPAEGGGAAGCSCGLPKLSGLSGPCRGANRWTA